MIYGCSDNYMEVYLSLDKIYVAATNTNMDRLGLERVYFFREKNAKYMNQ